MKNILFIILIAIGIVFIMFVPFTSDAQNNISDKYILIDSVWGASMANTLSVNSSYNFGEPLKTVGGRWVTPAINYIYFKFPDSVTVFRLPPDSFPQSVFTQTITPVK